MASPHCSLAVAISTDAYTCSGQNQSPGSNLGPGTGECRGSRLSGDGHHSFGTLALGDVCWRVLTEGYGALAVLEGRKWHLFSK